MLTNEKVNNVELDDFDPQVKIQVGVYALTITPDDGHQYEGHIDRMKLFRDWANAFVLCLPQDNIHYKLYFELSEPMTNERKQMSRLHLHGSIAFLTPKSIKKFWLFHQPRMNKVSNYKIVPITNIERWTSYYMKQQDIMDETPLASCVDIDSKLSPLYEVIKPVVIPKEKKTRQKKKGWQPYDDYPEDNITHINPDLDYSQAYAKDD